jgi:transposase-like protein
VKKRSFTEQQIIGFLKEAEAGIPVKELCRKHGFSDAAFYGWRRSLGGARQRNAMSGSVITNKTRTYLKIA